MARLGWREFEERVGEHFEEDFDRELKERLCRIGPEQRHKFDLVSLNRDIVIECKCYTWTDGQNFPQAKVSTANEALFFLSRVNAEGKMLVMQDDFNAKGQSLVKTYVERYSGVMDDTEVWRFVPQSTGGYRIERVRDAGTVYYQDLHQSTRESISGTGELEPVPDIEQTEEDADATTPTQDSDGTYSGKYAPLYDRLVEADSDEVTLNFDEINQLLDDPLPNSAYEYRVWWNPTGHSHAEGWESLGWTVTSLDLAAEQVVFERT